MSPPPDLALGLDLGTSGLRGLVLGPDGVVARAARPIAAEARRTPAAWAAALEEVLGALPLEGVRAVAVDATSGTLMGLDAAGEPLGAALLYSDRVEGSGPVDEAAPADSPARGAGSGAAKARALLSGGAARVAHEADWLASLLTGATPASDESNALKTGYDPHARAWPAWLAEAGVPPNRLPEVHPVGAALGPSGGALALRHGLDALVVAGTTDGCASFLATGASEPGDAVTALGSTIVLKVLADGPVASAAHGVYSHRLGDRWLPGGASNSGGAVLAALHAPDELAALSARIDPERTVPECYPLPRRGERFPVADPTLAPVMPKDADPVLRLHALLDGMARIEALGYARLAELGAPPVRRLFTVGGGAANDAWTALRRRRHDVPHHAPLSTEAAHGAARIARGAPWGAASKAVTIR